MSATENYFRDILARIISFCPISQEASAQQTINLGTVLWHGGKLASRGAFEHLSFTAADNIKQTCKRFLDIDIKRNSPVEAALLEFEKICELRHGVVHSGAILAGKNALKLQLTKSRPSATINVAFPELQEAAEICTVLSVATNTELFAIIVERWATQWRRHRAWDSSRANALFRVVWSTFRSKTDADSRHLAQPISKAACFKLVCAEFKL